MRVSLLLLILTGVCSAQSDFAALKESLLLHAPFDHAANAAFAKGDKTLFSTQSTKLTNPESGLKGDVKHAA